MTTPQLNDFEFTVTISAATREEAEYIMTQRIIGSDNTDPYGINDSYITIR